MSQIKVLELLLRELRDAHNNAEATGFVELDAESWMAEYAVRNCQKYLVALTEPKERLFPIQDGHPGVPWSAAEVAYKSYSRQFGTTQSLERLAKRGGFGLHEFSCLYLDVPYPWQKNSINRERLICEALAKLAQDRND